MKKQIKPNVETYELGNVKILIDISKVRIKNTYIEVSFAMGTTIYQTYVDCVRKAKSGDTDSESALKTLTNVLISVNMLHFDPGFIENCNHYFGDMLNKQKIKDGE